MPWFFVYFAKSSLVYLVPRSEWKMVTPGRVRPLRTAMSSAAMIKSVRMWSAIAYPTAFFVAQSSTVAR